MKNKKIKLILASRSPRRIELLKMLGCEFQVIPSNLEEEIDSSLSPIENVKRLARLKALHVASKLSDGIVIAADTEAVLGKKILGQPKNKKDAHRILKDLSGEEHQLITGIAIVNVKTKKVFQDAVITKVRLRKLSDKLIKEYINGGESWGKTGAYGIQGKGAILVESVNGNYTNLYGLPLNALSKLFKRMKITLL